MSWHEIKQTPRHELEGLMSAFNSYNLLHAYDGYTSDNIGEMAKNNPQVRSQYAKSQDFKARMETKMGRKRNLPSFSELIK